MTTPILDPPEDRWAGVREVVGLAWPIVLGSVSYTVLEFCDMGMVSKLGTQPFAAVGSARLWSYTMSTGLLGVVGCVSTFVGQSRGRGQSQFCAAYAWQGLYLSALAGLMLLLFWPVAPRLFHLMPHEAAVTDLEIVYFRVRLFGYLPMACMTALAAFFQAVDRPRIPMYSAIVATVVNIGLNYLLIFGNFGFPQWGVFGAAVATVIAQFIQMGMLFAWFLSRPLDKDYGTRSSRALDLSRLRELVRIGLPSGASMFLDIMNWALFTGFIVGYFGAVQLAAHNTAVSFIHVCFMPAVAMNQAIAPIVGGWIGRKDIARAKARTYTALGLAIVYMTSAGLFFALFGQQLIHATFSQDPEVIALGHKLLILAAVFQAFDAVNIVCMGALRGAGDTLWMMIATSGMAYFLFLPLAVYCAFVLNGAAFGAWIAATAYIVVLSFVLFARFRGEAWRHINVFSATDGE